MAAHIVEAVGVLSLNRAITCIVTLDDRPLMLVDVGRY
ncbi:hypothetical protein ACVJGD_002424 [Bradyrhizobium sp. USDA 10063]